MDAELMWRIFGILILVLASGFFAGAETALFSLSSHKREALAAKDDRGSRGVVALLSQPRRVIATIIVCNELINIGAASLAATVTARLMPQYQEWAQVLTASMVMVPLLILFGEMTPKSLAYAVGEPWARAIASPLRFFSLLVTPVRVVLQTIAGVIIRVIGGRPAEPSKGLGEVEFRALVDVGSEEGELEVTERRLIHNVFEFGDTTVGKVMTPGSKVFALPYETPLGRLVEQVSSQRFSRVPIYRTVGRGAHAKREARTEVVGILMAKDLVGYHQGALEGHTIADLMHPPLFVPKNTKCDRLFREFQRRKTHIALVVDEYGALAGLVTMENLLEELFGEIADEKEARA